MRGCEAAGDQLAFAAGPLVKSAVYEAELRPVSSGQVFLVGSQFVNVWPKAAGATASAVANEAWRTRIVILVVLSISDAASM